MTGWIIAGFAIAIAGLAIGWLWRRRRSDIRRLKTARKKAMSRQDDEHRRQLDRIQREHQRRLEAAHHPLARDLFPALDSLDEALDHADECGEDAATESLRDGVRLARQAIDDALSRHGVTPIVPAEGDVFDPELHEAISRTEDPEADINTIRQRFRRGYCDGDQVLRPALVEVNVATDQERSSPVSDPESSSSPLEPPEGVTDGSEPTSEPSSSTLSEEESRSPTDTASSSDSPSEPPESD